MQNAVTTVAWLMTNLELLAPLGSITIDISKFCAPLICTKVLVTFAVIYMSSSVVLAFVRTDRLNLLKLYNFPQSFRYRFVGVASAGLLIYIVVVQSMRRALKHREQRKVACDVDILVKPCEWRFLVGLCSQCLLN